MSLQRIHRENVLSGMASDLSRCLACSTASQMETAVIYGNAIREAAEHRDSHVGVKHVKAR